MKRKSGIFLHPSSLPSPFGIGDLGNEAYRWVDLLARYKQGVWQICPLGPVGYGWSPYNCHSSFAGNHLLISPDKLMESGLLTQQELADYPRLPDTHVDFDRVAHEKQIILRKAFTRFKSSEKYQAFCAQQRDWLDDYAVFTAIKKRNNGLPWYKWAKPAKMHDQEHVQAVSAELAEEIEWQKFLQFTFHTQWNDLHTYAGQKQVEIFGDLPYYVAYDSSDVWASKDIFKLNKQRDPVLVGGVPPDYFSASGQLWGNPVYNWKTLKENGYGWWIQRIKKSLEMVDWVRIDHFRGFEAFWAVPFGSSNAINGKWIKGPGIDFFTALQKQLGSIPLIAEDLGMITKQVDALRTSIGICGMRVLQFAFDGGADNPHRVHNIGKDAVIYTGTHDNDTTVGWLNKISWEFKNNISMYLDCPHERIMESLLRTAFMSAADWCILPLQDVLLLDGNHRMNTPGTVGANWQWRFTHDMISENRLSTIALYTERYGRCI